MNKKLYDTLCYISRFVLPALATLYATLGKIWNFPYITEIPASIMAVVVFLNVCLKIDSNKYFEDKEHVTY